MDSILLAAACPVVTGEKILDMGCGVGGAGLCVLARVAGVDLTGVEIQKDHADLAEYNAAAHNFAEQTDFITMDIRDYREEKAFHHVICNPPYLEAEKHLRSPSDEKATAMGHGDNKMTVKDWIDTAHFCLKSKGSLTMIHRADHLDKIIIGLGKRFGALEIFPFWPRQGEQASRVIVRAYKDRYSSMKMHAGLALHGEKDNRNYTAQTEKILRDGERLF